MIKVAAVQFAPVWGDKPENIKRLIRLIAAAASAGAKLIVLPELATTGYSFMGPEEAEPEAEIISLRTDTPLTTTMRLMYSMCKKYGVHIVWGMVEKDQGSGKLYNSQVYLAPDATYVSYRKINRWGNDYLWAEDGSANPPIVEARFFTGPDEDSSEVHRVGLLICRDVRDRKNDTWTNFYSKGDADIVAFSTNWGDGGFPSVSWMDFAMDNRVNLIVSNRYGQETCNDFGEGGTCVIEPSGKVHCKGLVWNQDCIILADVG